MRRYGYLLSIAALVAATVPAGAANPPLASGPPVLIYWAQHDEINELDHLPRPYSCDDLYYKYRDILLRLGVRPGMKIYTYGCSRKDQPASGTTRVNLTYSAPHQMSDPKAIDGVEAIPTMVRIAPGEPKSVTDGDCELLDEMRQTVLSSISNSIDASGLQCGSRRAARHFSLMIQALLPIADSSKLPPD